MATQIENLARSVRELATSADAYQGRADETRRRLQDALSHIHDSAAQVPGAGDSAHPLQQAIADLNEIGPEIMRVSQLARGYSAKLTSNG